MAYSIEKHPNESTSKFLRENPAPSEICREISCQFIAVLAKSVDHVNRDSAFNEGRPRRSTAAAGPLKSKIGISGFGQRHQSVVEEIAVIFIACGGRERCVFDAAPPLHRRPRHREGARILDVNVHLQRLAAVVNQHSRSTDLAARYGGDEFAIVMIDSDKVMADQVAHRIVNGLHTDQGTPSISVSIGIGIYPEDGRTAPELIEAADRQLFKYKRTDRIFPTNKCE